MKVFAIDMLAQSGDRTPLRTVQVPAASVDEAMQKAHKSMSQDETAVRVNPHHTPRPVGRLLDIRV
ncbi:MAG TPA: hypothetical protein VJS38_18480 [Phenylobacterium sp.]|uniref:hypothetical protein n=1 Tax=Phenylobacterium sp. TaxID=1871053 RepID=UPI002B45E278|nr:hypothetical protein [Phenylobacterium sp.]HKR90159.1 hypothetical protein [Phenylobacterium sp.]HKT54582.1 hypothetical protein [Caulobacteraceae bacterium]